MAGQNGKWYLGMTALLLAGCGASDGAADSCEILTAVEVRLGGEGDFGSFPGIPSVSPRLGSGLYIGAGRWHNAVEAPSLFDEEGRFLRPLGSVGDGPGEYRGATLFHPYRGDSILILDGATRRASILDRDARFVRSFPVPATTHDALVLADGALVLADNSPGQQFPIAVVAPGGARRTRFGLDAPPDSAAPTARFVARNGLTSIWAVPTTRNYHFEQWSLDGTRLRTLQPEREWFVSGLPPVDHSPTMAMRPFMVGLWQDSTGLLWAVADVADEQWAEGLGPLTTGPEGTEFYPIRNWTLAWDGIVEAMDTLTGAVVARRRFDSPIFLVAEPGLVVQARQAADGVWKADLVRVRLSDACAGMMGGRSDSLAGGAP